MYNRNNADFSSKVNNMDFFSMSIGSALAFLGGVGAALYLLLDIIKRLFEHAKDSKKDPAKKESQSEITAIEEIRASMKKLEDEYHADIAKFESQAIKENSELREFILNVSKERKEEIRRVTDRLEKLYDKILEWMAEQKK